MAFKWGTDEVKKVKIIKDGVVLTESAKKVVFNGNTVFESQTEHTYVVDVNVNYYWGGTMTNNEYWDDPDGEETLSHNTAGDIRIGISLSITRDGAPYTPSSNDVQMEYTLEVRVAHGEELPTKNDGIIYKTDFNGEPEYISSVEKKWTPARGTVVDSYWASDEGTYWWFTFVSRNLYLVFKGNAKQVPDFYTPIKSIRDNWRTYSWTPMANPLSMTIASYTFKIVE